MKILFFIENLRSGGKERRLVELIKGLKHYPEIEMELVLTRNEIHYKDIINTGIKIHYIIRKGLKKDPRLFWKFFIIAKKFKPDVIHVWGNMVAIYAIPAKVFLNIQLINSQITDVPIRVKTGLLNHKTTFLFSDIILSNSQAGLLAYNAPSQKSYVIYNGFNFSRIKDLKAIQDIRDQYSIKEKHIVAMVGGFKPLKDNKTFLQSVNFILKERDDINFLCIGRGDPTPFKRYVDDKYIEKVIFTGEVNQVEQIMSICSIGVLTSFNEGIPNTIMEFMALKIPVIVTEGGGISELVDNNESGYIIPQRDPEILAKKVLELLSDTEKRISMGEKGRQKIESHFKLETMIEKHYSIYQKLLY